MKYFATIEIKESARKDLLEIYEHIRKDSDYYAVKTINQIQKYINNIKLFPYSGRKILEINQENFLEIIYKKFRIMYKIESSHRVSILRIFHSSRKFQID